jgi:hypothetical protein
MKNTTNFAAVNFDSFGSPVPAAEKAAMGKQIRQDWRSFVKAAIILAIIAAVIAYALLALSGNVYIGLIPVVTYLLFIGWPLTIGSEILAPDLRETFELKRFAAMNQFTYATSTQNIGRQGTIFVKHKTDTTDDLIFVSSPSR